MSDPPSGGGFVLDETPLDSGFELEGTVTGGEFILDETPLDSEFFILAQTGDPFVISAGEILVELQAYDLTIGGIVTLYFGSDGYSDASGPGYYEPRMTQPLNFRRDMYAVATTGGATRVAFGEMRLANNDGWLDSLRSYGLAGQEVRLLIGDIRQSYTTFEPLILGRVQQALFTTTEVVIQLRDRLQDFAQPAQANKYLGNNVLPDGLEGVDDLKDKPKPLVFGRVQNISPPLVNTAKLIYQINDGPIEDAAVYDNGAALTRDTDYPDVATMMASAPAPGFFRVVSTTSGSYFRLGETPAGTVTCDAADKIAAVDNTAAQVARRIAARPPEEFTLDETPLDTQPGQAGIGDIDIVWTDVIALDIANSATVGIWIPDETQFGAALDAVLTSVGAWYGFDRFGMFRMQRLELPVAPYLATFRQFDDINDAGFGEYDIVAIRFIPTNDPDKGLPTWQVSLSYSLNYTVQSGSNVAGVVTQDRKNFLSLATRSAVTTDASVKNPYPLAVQKKYNVLLLDQAAAAAESARVLEMFKVQRDFIEIDTPLVSDLVSLIDIGSVVNVVIPRFNYDGGRLMRVLGMQYNALSRILTVALWG